MLRQMMDVLASLSFKVIDNVGENIPRGKKETVKKENAETGLRFA